MIYLFAIFAALALFQLGTLSVWVVVLTQTIKVLLFILSFGLLYFVWRQYKATKNNNSSNSKQGKLEDRS